MGLKPLKRGLAIAVLAALAALVPAAGAGANVVPVTPGSSDVADLNTADAGICDAGAGVCTVRAAIQTANSAGLPGPDTIEIPAGTYTLTIPGADDASALGDLDITTNLEIKGLGAGATITGDVPTPVDRILHIPSGVPAVAISNLTITNGKSPMSDHGGAIKHESGSLAISGSSVTNSSTTGQQTKGGGIFAGASATSLSLTDSTVSGNHVAPNALGGSGGGIHTDARVTLNRVTISGNNASQSCGNLCGGTGGGIHVAAGPSAFTNVTVSGNHSWGGTPSAFAFGGGIDHSSGTLTLLNSTVVGNVADSGFTVGGGNIISTGSVIFENTIIAGGSGPPGTENCGVDAFNPYTSQGHNLESPTNQCNLSGPGDQPSVANAMLGGLGANGGPTLTHALMPLSPAINAASANGPATDQRGTARPQGAACDIGAFELVMPGAVAGSTCAGPPSSSPPPSPVSTPIGPGPAPGSGSGAKKCKRKKGKPAAKKKRCKKRKK